MSIFDERPLARWTLPVAAGALAVGAFVWPSQAQADPLPARSAEQLLVDVAEAKVVGLSGTLSETAQLGLPALPAGMASGGQTASLASLVQGTHTARVWVSGERLCRVAIQADAQETNIVRNDNQVWQWTSSQHMATHVILPQHEDGNAHPAPTKAPAAQAPTTPQEAAQKIVAALSGSSTVTTADNSTVAGRPVYELVLTPKQADSRVASVRIAIDGESHVPTRVQVFSTQLATPAIELGFTEVDFTRPSDDVFAFTPPAGATVVTKDLTKELAKVKDHPQGKDAATHSGTDASDHEALPISDQKLSGTGWAEVASGRVDLKALAKATSESSANQASQESTPAAAQLLTLFPRTSGAWGSGRVLDGTLFSVVVTDDGRFAVGAVAPESLYRALPVK